MSSRFNILFVAMLILTLMIGCLPTSNKTQSEQQSTNPSALNQPSESPKIPEKQKHLANAIKKKECSLGITPVYILCP
jgi:hypothetical protein